jgi:hypothetical protein
MCRILRKYLIASRIAPFVCYQEIIIVVFDARIKINQTEILRNIPELQRGYVMIGKVNFIVQWQLNELLKRLFKINRMFYSDLLESLDELSSESSLLWLSDSSLSLSDSDCSSPCGLFLTSSTSELSESESSSSESNFLVGAVRLLVFTSTKLELEGFLTVNSTS